MTLPSPHRAVLVTAAATALALPSIGQAASTTTPLAGPKDPPLELQGGYDQFTGGIPVPNRWTSVAGTVRLRWNASPQLADGSAMQVRVGEQIVGTISLRPGAGSATLPVPRQALRGDNRVVPIAIQARIRLKNDVCPATDDPAAWLQFSRSSALTVDGQAAVAAPQLKDLPRALLTGVGRKRSRLLVRFESAPTAASVRAAALAAGEIDALAGDQGLQIRVGLPGSPTRRADGEAAIVVRGGSGPATIRTTLLGGTPAIELSGSDEQLLRAAGALRPSVARRLTGVIARGAQLPAVKATRSSFPRRVRLPTGSTSGVGEGQISLDFRVPEYLEALRGSRLRLAGTYDAPAGGRAVIGINGRDIDSQTLQAKGQSRFFVEEELAPRGPSLYRADLRAGRNTVTVSTRLTRPRDLRCQPSDSGGGVEVSEFGSVTLLTRPRPLQATISAFPFPLSRKVGWQGSTVQLPPKPTEAELAAVLGTLAEARRVTGELALPQIAFGTGVPRGTALVLARPGQVPAELVRDVPGPKDAGVLSASKDGSAVRILAIGPKALRPLANGYFIGKVQGRTVESLNADRAAIRVGDKELVTGIQRGPVPWRWPLLVIGLAILAFAVVALRRTLVRLRRRTASAPTMPTEKADEQGGDGERRDS
ncbi:cellulose biosynthesis cyclic di-GMP-binding regulatory protein BcsB [Patulibacter medicamentivorans]|uniref:cellulose biosynthesis cyclic di-GMP-binding regulatory protein BcsB n=1 Tax=Patulibacter medicamentivorans TaxID=1097667 RepID=UPI00058D58DC|nr:cellulose biosynthesis cyclic di-GMP-binding regulatory protein BcsB [Patulibacter medicamentivorans]